MPTDTELKPHFYLGPTGKSENFTSPSGGGGGHSNIPEQNRQQHATSLFNQLNQITNRQTELKNEASSYELELPIGIQIEFESFPGIELGIGTQ